MDKKLENVWHLMNEFDFQFDLKFPVDLICVLCKKILIDTRVSPCGCRFCKKCIYRYLTTGDMVCPGHPDESDEQGILSLEKNVSVDHVVNRKIATLRMKCPIEMCSNTDQIINLVDHVNLCRKLAVKCPYSNVGCNFISLDGETITGHVNKSKDCHIKLMMSRIETVEIENKSMKQQSMTPQTLGQEMQVKLNEQNLELNERARKIARLDESSCQGKSQKNEVDELKYRLDIYLKADTREFTWKIENYTQMKWATRSLFDPNTSSESFNPNASSASLNPKTSASFNPNASSASFNLNASSGSFNPNTSSSSFYTNTSSASFNPNTSSASFCPKTSASFNPNASSASFNPNTSSSFYPNTSFASFNPNTSSASFNPNSSSSSFYPNTFSASFNPNSSFASINPNSSSASFNPNSSSASFNPNSCFTSFTFGQPDLSTQSLSFNTDDKQSQLATRHGLGCTKKPNLLTMYSDEFSIDLDGTKMQLYSYYDQSSYHVCAWLVTGCRNPYRPWPIKCNVTLGIINETSGQYFLSINKTLEYTALNKSCESFEFTKPLMDNINATDITVKCSVKMLL